MKHISAYITADFSFNSRAYTLAVVNKLKASLPKVVVETTVEPPVETGTPVIHLEKRLNLIK